MSGGLREVATFCPLWLPMRTSLIAALCLLTALPICAQTPAQPTRLGLCAACHGASGHASMPGVPNLAGPRLDYLRDALKQIGSASCRERVCPYVLISGDAVSLKKKSNEEKSD